jgi:hypothetical protein
MYTMPYFSIIGIIFGISLASVSNGVFSFPFLWISKFWGKEMISEKYQAFMGLGLLVYNIAQLLINYVFDDLGMLIQWWICCSCFFLSLIIYLIILFGITFFHRFKFINNDYESISMKQRCKTVVNFIKGMFMLIIDILIFLVVVVVVIVMSGFLNIVLALMFNTQNSLTEVMYLPILFMFMIISVTLVFPEAISRFAGVLFFKNCRRELNYPLVSDVIKRNPNMTLATLAMKTKFQSAWEKCNTRYMNEKILVKVVADDYLTSDAMNFPRIEFKTMDSEASTITFRMEESHKWIKKAARNIDLELSHKKLILNSIAREEDKLNLREELNKISEDEIQIENSLEKNESLEKEHLSHDIYLHRVSVRLYSLYKLWQARKPLGFRIDFSAENEFNFRMFFTWIDCSIFYFTLVHFDSCVHC